MMFDDLLILTQVRSWPNKSKEEIEHIRQDGYKCLYWREHINNSDKRKYKQ